MYVKIFFVRYILYVYQIYFGYCRLKVHATICRVCMYDFVQILSSLYALLVARTKRGYAIELPFLFLLFIWLVQTRNSGIAIYFGKNNYRSIFHKIHNSAIVVAERSGSVEYWWCCGFSSWIIIFDFCYSVIGRNHENDAQTHVMYVCQISRTILYQTIFNTII